MMKDRPSTSEPRNPEPVDAAPKKREAGHGFGWMLAYLRPYRASFIPAAAALFVTSGLSLVFPWLMGDLIGGSMTAAAADPEAVGRNINRVALILAGTLALQAFIAYWRVRWFARAGEQALGDMRRDTYARLIRLPMTFFGAHRVGELSSRIASDLGMLRETLISTVPQIVRHSVMLIGGLVFIFISSWKLSLFMLACLPVVILLVAIFGRRIRGLSRSAQDRLAETQVVVEETLQGIHNVKAFSNETFETQRYDHAIRRFLSATLQAAGARAAFVSFIIFALFGVITLVVWFGAGLLQKGVVSPPEFTRFVLFTVFVGAALGSLPEVFSQIQNASGATQRVREILLEPAEDRRAQLPTPASRLHGEVALEGVRFQYPSRPDVDVLRDVSFHADAGQRIALVGPSGAGKSTVIQLLLGFYEPAGGRILFDGRPAAEYPLDYLRSQIAIVPQEVLLFGGSIRENIAYGRPDAPDEAILAAARQANAHEFISAFPEGYDTTVGDRGIQLSGGQRQRIAIARAILADPALLILDEATSSLDSESERLVQEALETLMANRTSIIIAHRLATVRHADRIIVLQGGRTIESGTHDELSANTEGVYRMLAELQFAS